MRSTTLLSESPSKLAAKSLEPTVYPSPVATLTVRVGAAPPVVFLITRAKTILGRMDGVCDITLEDGIVSSRHLAIYVYPNGMAFVEDIGSTNGSFLLTEPPIRLDAHSRVQWSDGTRPAQYSVGLGGSRKIELSLSEIRLPTSAVAVSATTAVPPTLVEESSDDDESPPPPAALANFERRKVQPDSPPTMLPVEPVVDHASLSVGDIDATLDYQSVLPKPHIAATNSPQSNHGSSGSLVGFCASPPFQPPPQVESEGALAPLPPTVRSDSDITCTHSSSVGVGVLSPTPPPALPNTLASTKSQTNCNEDDDDESPPAPSSAMRRRLVSLQEEMTGAPIDGLGGMVSPPFCMVQPTLDVAGLSPANRALEFEDEALKVHASGPDVSAAAAVDSLTTKRAARASSEEAVEQISEKKRQREPEAKVAPCSSVHPIEPSPTPASAASPSSSAIKKRGGPRSEAAVPMEAEVVVPSVPPAAVVATAAPPAAAVRWQFKIDLRKAATREDAWEDYPAADSAIIEAAFLAYDAAAGASKKRPKKTLIETKLSATYGVHFEDMVQFRYDDRTRQRPIRRKK